MFVYCKSAKVFFSTYYIIVLKNVLLKSEVGNSPKNKIKIVLRNRISQ